MADFEKQTSVEQEMATQVEKLGPEKAAIVAAQQFEHPTPDEEAKVIRKLDRRLLPLVFVLYSLAVLDRSNLGNARLAGLQTDIDIAGERCK